MPGGSGEGITDPLPAHDRRAIRILSVALFLYLPFLCLLLLCGAAVRVASARRPGQSRAPAGRNGASTQGSSPPFRRSARATVSAMGVSPISAARNARYRR